MPQFDTAFYISQIFWLLISLLILVVYFKKILFPKLEDVLQERYLKIEKAQEQIEKLKKQIKELEDLKKFKIDQANFQAAAYLAKSRFQIIEESDKKLKNLDQDIQVKISGFSQALDAQIQEAESLYHALSEEYAGIIQEKITPIKESSDA
ncbi:MAG: ATP synthase subunit b [Holosporales bacterium]